MLQSHDFVRLPVLAYRHPLVGAPGIGFHGGPVITELDRRKLRHSRYHEPCDWFDGFETATDTLTGAYVYIGPAYGHFGHVMSEMVHRILPSNPLEGRKWLMVTTSGDTALRNVWDLPVFMQDVLGMCSIDPENVTILNADRVVDHLRIAQQGSDFGGGPLPDYLDLLAAFNERLFAGSDRPGSPNIYVSRSALPGGGGFLGERYVERALEAVGFSIVRPEAMSLFDQMRRYRGAGVAIFPEGSACHGLELLGPASLDTAILLARRTDHMDIFARVLRPRAKTYAAIPPAPGTGSIFQTLKHLTVGVMAHRELFAMLREHGVATAIPFDEAEYRRQCEADLDRFVAHHLAQATDAIDPAQLVLAQASVAPR